MHFLKMTADSVDVLLPWEDARDPYVPRDPIKAENGTVRMYVESNPFHMLLFQMGGQYDNPGFFEVRREDGCTLP